MVWWRTHDWECSEGHILKSTWANIRSHNGFCEGCHNEKKYQFNLEQAKQLAREKGGQCLSKLIVNNRSNSTKWKCQNGHIWDASVESIKFADSWCPTCNSGDQINLENMKILAAKRGGECLEFIGTKNRGKVFKWKCALSHIFTANTNNVKKGSWCPDCSKSLGERICREFFEKFFQESFPSSKPVWLKNKKTGGRLELDGYSSKLGIAFEHQGKHHYNTKTHLFSTKNPNIQELDDLKSKLCSENNVILIKIPEIPSYLKITDLSNFLQNQFLKNGIISEIKQFNFEPYDAYRTTESIRHYKKLEKIVNDKGGILRSKFYLGAFEKHEIQCSCGYIFFSRAHNIVSGRWCPECGKKSRIKNIKIAIEKKRKENLFLK